MRILIPEMNRINKMYLYLTATTARSHRATSDISVRTAFDGVWDWFFILIFSQLLNHHRMCGSARVCDCFPCHKRCDLKSSFKTSVVPRRTWSREILIPSTSWTAPSKSNFGFSFLLSKVQSTPPLISEKSNGVQSSKLQYCGLSSICFYCATMANDSTPVASLSNENWLKNVASRTSEITTGS